MRKKVLVIVYNIERAKEHEWLVEYIDRDRFCLEFVLINRPGSYLSRFLNQHNVPVHFYSSAGKLSLIGLTLRLFMLMLKNRYHIVHAHLFEATISGMLAAWLAGVPLRVITRHNSDFHHVYFPQAVKYDRLAANLATRVIAVSNIVRDILVNREKISEKKVLVIHHGIDFNEFNHDKTDPAVDAMREKYSIDKSAYVIGVVSRFIEWKGVQYIVEAFKMYMEQNPRALLILTNAQGPYTGEITRLLSSIPGNRYRLITFEAQINILYKTFDCFVHTPVSETAEAFGQTYIEAMAARVPCIITRSGIACEFAIHHVNCRIVPFRDSVAILNSFTETTGAADKNLMITNRAYDEVREKFDVKTKYKALSDLYENG